MMPELYVAGHRVPFHATRLPVRCKRCTRPAHECDCPDAAVIGVVP